MNVSAVWSRETWRRATSPTIPAVRVVDGRMVSDATLHSGRYVGDGAWVIDYLPGRQLSERQARAAMHIAIAPELPEVARWACSLGLTVAEAVSYAAEAVSR
ncbi:hypothetical protein ACFYTF_28895 [Nocardia thailandica]|uniref:Uncharacterized protein n=1 Tax=Nocardia thailandica TaxID=257275 RepID=A0ABW6PWP9_9NOCA